MDELVIEGKVYISSKRAARISGYTKDYIGQLCRAEALPAKKVGRSWYIEEDALKEHRKTYQGEPITDSSVWDVDKVEEDSRSLKDIASQYIDEGEKKRKSELLHELFELKYEKEDGPLIPELVKRAPKSDISIKQTPPHELSHEITHEEEKDEDTLKKPVSEPTPKKQEAAPQRTPLRVNKAEPAPVISSRKSPTRPQVVYVDLEDVLDAPHEQKHSYTQFEEATSSRFRITGYVVLGFFILFFSLGIFLFQTKDVYEQNNSEYVRGKRSIVLSNFRSLFSNFKALWVSDSMQ